MQQQRHPCEEERGHPRRVKASVSFQRPTWRRTDQMRTEANVHRCEQGDATAAAVKWASVGQPELNVGLGQPLQLHRAEAAGRLVVAYLEWPSGLFEVSLFSGAEFRNEWKEEPSRKQAACNLIEA